MALSETFRGAMGVRERVPFLRKKTDIQKLREEIPDVIRDAVRKPQSNFLLMTIDRRTNTATIDLDSGERIQLEKERALGVLDLNGRQREFYKWLPGERAEGDNTVRTAIHPNVFEPRSVYFADHIYDSNGNEIIEAWFTRRTLKPDHDLFSQGSQAQTKEHVDTEKNNFFVGVELEESVDVRLKVLT